MLRFRQTVGICLVNMNEARALTVADDWDDCHGSPVALQLVGRRFEEEKVLSLVQYVEGLINEATQRM